MFASETPQQRTFKKKQTANLKVGIVQALFNQEITDYLAQSCQTELKKQGIKEKNILLAQVPGAAEIPLTLQSLLDNCYFDVLIAIGCIIRGETYHFEIVANESASGISKVSLEFGVPIINTIITTENQQQALERQAVKGISAAHAALDMALLINSINE